MKIKYYILFFCKIRKTPGDQLELWPGVCQSHHLVWTADDVTSEN